MRTTLQPLLGQRLRDARRARGLNLSDVAEATGISVSSLSLVERGENEPTIGRFARLCFFYELPLDEFLPPDVMPAGRVVHPDEAPELAFPGEGLRVTFVRPPAGALMQPVVLELDPGAGYAEPVTIEADVFFTVVEGELTISVGTDGDETLSQGDSLYLPQATAHRCRNASPEHPVRAIVVTSPPAAPPT